MDVAKVARDYFLSSQSSLLIPNREYGSRKLIRVGIGRSNSAGNVLRNNNNSNINKSHHREEEEERDNSFSRRPGVFTNSKAKSRSLSGVPEENGVREYPWRTLSSINTTDTPLHDLDSAEEYTPASSTSFTSSPAPTENNPRSVNPGSESSPRSSVSARRNNFNTLRSVSLSALSSSPSLSSSSSTPSSISPRPRPTSLSSSSNTSGATTTGLGNLKGLFGANMNNGSGIIEKALAMKSGK